LPVGVGKFGMVILSALSRVSVFIFSTFKKLSLVVYINPSVPLTVLKRASLLRFMILGIGSG